MKKRLLSLCAVLCLMVCLAVGAAATQLTGEPNITAQTTMKELWSHPSLAGSGIWLHPKYSFSPELQQCLYDDQTLQQYVGPENAQACADSLNLVIELYNAGTQITYPLYTADEIAANPACKNVELYYVPATQPNAKYVILLEGNSATRTGEMKECYAPIKQLHDMGYAVFALRYRVFVDIANNAPLDDLARAIGYITQNADAFSVQTDNYAIMGFSSGGQLAGVMASYEYGYGHYGLPKPGALLLGYPVNDFFEVKPLYHIVYDFGATEPRYYCYNISDLITPDYPPTYFWYGENDTTLMMMGYDLQGPVLRKALEDNGVPHRVIVYKNAPHASAVGTGTDAEGWLSDAAAFWEEQTAS